MKLNHTFESGTEESDAAIHPINIRFDQLANCIFRYVLTVHIENVLAPTFEFLSAHVLICFFALQKGQAKPIEQRIPELEGKGEELMKTNDVGQGSDNGPVECSMGQILLRVLQERELPD